MYVTVKTRIEAHAWDIRGALAEVTAILYLPGSEQSVTVRLSAQRARDLAVALEHAAKDAERCF